MAKGKLSYTAKTPRNQTGSKPGRKGGTRTARKPRNRKSTRRYT